MSAWGEQIADWGYAAGWKAAQILPEPMARSAADLGAAFGARDGGPEQLRKNLARVLGVHADEVPQRLILDSMRSYGRYWREAFRLPAQNMTRLAARLDSTVFGRSNIDEAACHGRGTIMALPHSGNWDMAGVWLAHTYDTFTTVAERLKPESLYRRFLEYRETLGFEVLPLTGDSAGPYATLAQRLRDNRVICLMSDRDLSRSGVPVNFFGAEARMPAGPARLAVETGARLLPAHCWFEPHGQWGVRIHPPLDTTSGDVSAITQAMADVFAANISERPADWHMMQPLWLEDLAEDHRRKLAEADQPATQSPHTERPAEQRETDPVGGQP